MYACMLTPGMQVSYQVQTCGGVSESEFNNKANLQEQFREAVSTPHNSITPNHVTITSVTSTDCTRRWGLSSLYRRASAGLSVSRFAAIQYVDSSQLCDIGGFDLDGRKRSCCQWFICVDTSRRAGEFSVTLVPAFFLHPFSNAIAVHID